MAFHKQTIKDISVDGKTILLRAPLNVPIENDKVTDDARLRAFLPTLEYLLERHTKLVLISHHSSEGMSLAPVAPVLAKLLGRPVSFAPDSIGKDTEAAIHALKPGDVLVLENLRLHPEEEANDDVFAKTLASYGQIFVSDDFTDMHREHASIVSIPRYLPAVAGLLVEREVDQLTTAMAHPEHPLVLMVGGAKISTKIAFLQKLLEQADALLIGGAMANTFFASAGREIGKSTYDEDDLDVATEVVKAAEAKDVKLLLPTDVVVAAELDQPATKRTVPLDEVKPDDRILDMGTESIEAFTEVVSTAKTIVWNGTFGVTEVEAFATGSKALAEAIVASGATSIIGGGDTIGFVGSLGITDKFDYVSTGGGASLELMAGHKLPGVEALLDKK